MITLETFNTKPSKFPAVDLATRLAVAHTYRGSVYGQQGLSVTQAMRDGLRDTASKINTQSVLEHLSKLKDSSVGASR
jgi:hypothetical protein